MNSTCWSSTAMAPTDAFQCISEQKGAAWPESRRFQGRNLREERVRGEVVVVPLDKDGALDAELDRLSHFDLVLLYCGSIASAAAIVNRWNAADAIVLVAKGRELEAGLVEELRGRASRGSLHRRGSGAGRRTRDEAGMTGAHASAGRISPTGRAAKWLTTLGIDRSLLHLADGVDRHRRQL